VKAVIDTNVVAYFLLGTEAFVAEARACLEFVSTPIAPAHWEAELTNVVWMAVQTGVLAAADGPARLGMARRLGIESITTAPLCQGALLRSIQSRVSPYDTLFVELAARSDCPLLTFDAALVRAFPDVARRPRDLLDG
jgi:predicted nucleic acid-binding protein